MNIIRHIKLFIATDRSLQISDNIFLISNLIHQKSGLGQNLVVRLSLISGQLLVSNLTRELCLVPHRTKYYWRPSQSNKYEGSFQNSNFWLETCKKLKAGPEWWRLQWTLRQELITRNGSEIWKTSNASCQAMIDNYSEDNFSSEEVRISFWNVVL